jgi:hypothetical protein
MVQLNWLVGKRTFQWLKQGHVPFPQQMDSLMFACELLHCTVITTLYDVK